MKYAIITLLLLVLSSYCFGQYKILKLNVDSNKIYLRYYYKIKRASDEIINDSVTLIWKKVATDTFNLDKFVYKRKQWTKVYKIALAMDSLRNVTRGRNAQGVYKNTYSKLPYYNSILIEN